MHICSLSFRRRRRRCLCYTNTQKPNYPATPYIYRWKNCNVISISFTFKCDHFTCICARENINWKPQRKGTVHWWSHVFVYVALEVVLFRFCLRTRRVKKAYCETSMDLSTYNCAFVAKIYNWLLVYGPVAIQMKVFFLLFFISYHCCNR